MLTRPAARRRPVFPSTLFATSAFAFQLAIAQSTPPPHLDPVNRTVWSDDKLRLRFTYPPVWQQAVATQSSTRTVINWRLTKSKTLLASCYIEINGPETSSLARTESSLIHKNIDSIAQSALRNFQARAPNARLIEARAAMQDGHSVIFLIREGTVDNINNSVHIKTYSIVTSWHGTEVNFECGTSIFGPKYTLPDGDQRLILQVEGGILNVLSALQFDRIVK